MTYYIFGFFFWKTQKQVCALLWLSSLSFWSRAKLVYIASVWVLFLLPAISAGFVHRLGAWGFFFFLCVCVLDFFHSAGFQACTLFIIGLLNVCGFNPTVNYGSPFEKETKPPKLVAVYKCKWWMRICLLVVVLHTIYFWKQIAAIHCFSSSLNCNLRSGLFCPVMTEEDHFFPLLKYVCILSPIHMKNKQTNWSGDQSPWHCSRIKEIKLEIFFFLCAWITLQ